MRLILLRIPDCYLIKELEVKQFLDTDSELHQILCGQKFIHNKAIRICGSFRPDFRIDVQSHTVVIEVDEHQHRSYDQVSEIDRMRRITDDMGWPCVFIRYNPDSYHENGKTIRISKSQRLLKLKQTVMYHLTRLWGQESIHYHKRMIIHKLYYDE